MERCQSLKRWHHPEQGIISPAEFLLKLEPAGLLQKLGETMIKQALQALTFWDKSGLNVPRIGVNFSTSELRNPRLVDRIAMHLDVSNIARHRLVIEVLETVIADGADNDIIGNLAALADLGCGIDLDDFGTGYASITNIRRFSVGRIKIDHSFVAGVDTDSEQRNMVAAILTMADRLGVQTLAEGVETGGEQDALKALGCHDVQGFQIARPMPIQATIQWASAYFHRYQEPVPLPKRASYRTPCDKAALSPQN
jgi:EAL domain-containing protein (putative c-di-GMP-specific phosphodiesterase class I)